MIIITITITTTTIIIIVTSPLHESRLLWIHDPYPRQIPRVHPQSQKQPTKCPGIIPQCPGIITT